MVSSTVGKVVVGQLINDRLIHMGPPSWLFRPCQPISPARLVLGDRHIRGHLLLKKHCSSNLLGASPKVERNITENTHLVASNQRSPLPVVIRRPLRLVQTLSGGSTNKDRTLEHNVSHVNRVDEQQTIENIYMAKRHLP